MELQTTEPGDPAANPMAQLVARPAADQPPDDQPPAGQPREDQPPADKPREDQPCEGQPREGQPPEVPAGFDRVGALRRARRVADLSQREMAAQVGVSRSVIGRAESDRGSASLELLIAVLGVAGLQLSVLDGDGRPVAPMRPRTVRNRAGRRFPAHLDTRLPGALATRGDPWRYDRPKPDVTFHHRFRRDRPWLQGGDVWPSPMPRQHDHLTPAELAACDRARRAKARLRRWRPRSPEPYDPCLCGPECVVHCDPVCPCQCEPENLVEPADEAALRTARRAWLAACEEPEAEWLRNIVGSDPVDGPAAFAPGNRPDTPAAPEEPRAPAATEVATAAGELAADDAGDDEPAAEDSAFEAAQLWRLTRCPSWPPNATWSPNATWPPARVTSHSRQPRRVVRTVRHRDVVVSLDRALRAASHQTNSDQATFDRATSSDQATSSDRATPDQAASDQAISDTTTSSAGSSDHAPQAGAWSECSRGEGGDGPTRDIWSDSDRRGRQL